MNAAPTKGASVDAELARARETLRVAQTLADAGLYADAVGRAYYAMFPRPGSEYQVKTWVGAASCRRSWKWNPPSST